MCDVRFLPSGRFLAVLHEIGFDCAYNGGMGPLESIIKAGIRVYTMERPLDTPRSRPVNNPAQGTKALFRILSAISRVKIRALGGSQWIPSL